MNRRVPCTLALAALAMQTAGLQYAADVRHLTLKEAVHLAIGQNRALKIARLKVRENEYKKAGERSAYFPSITNESNALHITDLPARVSLKPASIDLLGRAAEPHK